MLTPAEARRAPVGDFPPPYASSWGDDPYGLWVGVELEENSSPDKDGLLLRWIEPTLDGYGRVIEKGYWMLPESIAQDQVRGLVEKIEKLVNEKLTFEIRGYNQGDDPEKNM